MKIGVFTEFDDPYREVADLTVPILREYCDRQGYELTVAENPKVERSIVWDRVQVLLRNMPNYDYVVHIDSDVLITNFLRLSDWVFRPIVVGSCWREDGSLHLNDGILIAENCYDGHKVLAHSGGYFPDGTKIFCAQDALEWEYMHYFRNLIHVEAKLQSFLYPEYGMSPLTRGNWTPGDFALHLPGISIPRRVEILKDKIPLILR